MTAPAEPRSWTLTLPEGTPIITGNNRMNRYARNARTQALKGIVVALARQQRIPQLEAAAITVEYATPPRLRKDRHPLASEALLDHDAVWPTGKALADGFVLGGVLASDQAKRLRPPVCRLAPETHPRGLVRITITEVPAADDNRQPPRLAAGPHAREATS